MSTFINSCFALSNLIGFSKHFFSQFSLQDSTSFTCAKETDSDSRSLFVVVVVAVVVVLRLICFI